MPTRTGYDNKLVQRAGDTFAATVDKPGKVIEVNDYAVTVQYEDGTLRHVEIGRKFGSSGGFTMPHDVISNVKVGDKLEAGDVIAYHSGFFTKDPLNPKGIAYKPGKLVRVALMESPYTYEDSTAISKRLSLDTEIQTTVVKEVVVNFEQSIHRLAKPGTQVMVDDPLCFIEDALTNVPKSSVKGVVDKVEVFYNGDKEDMSESLRKIANLSDSKIVARQKALGKMPYTGMVDDTYRVNGNPLLLDTAVIKFTITSNNYLSTGDKIVFGAQLKATIAHVFEESPRINTEDNQPGEEIDAVFGSQSVYNRIVNSPFLMGMSNSILVEMSKRIGQEYLSNK